MKDLLPVVDLLDYDYREEKKLQSKRKRRKFCAYCNGRSKNVSRNSTILSRIHTVQATKTRINVSNLACCQL